MTLESLNDYVDDARMAKAKKKGDDGSGYTYSCLKCGQKYIVRALWRDGKYIVPIEVHSASMEGSRCHMAGCSGQVGPRSPITPAAPRDEEVGQRN